MRRTARLASGWPIALETNGTVREGARFGLDHVHIAAVDGELEVHEAHDAELERHQLGLALDLGDDVGRERVRGQHAGRVAGVDAGLLDVLHDAADPDLLAVAERVDVDLDRLLEEAVEVDLPRAESAGAAEVVGKALVGVHDLHGAATEHVRRPSEEREADGARDDQRVLAGGGGRVRRCDEPEAIEQVAEAAAVLGEVDRVDARAEDRHPGLLEPGGELERRWPPNCTITPSGCSTSTIASTSSSVSGSK